LHGALADWLRRPWEYVLYWYFVLQERDRRERWQERMQRLDTASLIAIAFHEPKRLADERASAIAAAGPPITLSNEEIVQRGIAMAFDIQRAKLIEVS